MHNYDILTNPIYSDRFLYTPQSYPERHEYIISPYKDAHLRNYSSDLVRLVADLAYLPRSQALAVKFDEKSIFLSMVQQRKRLV